MLFFDLWRFPLTFLVFPNYPSRNCQTRCYRYSLLHCCTFSSLFIIFTTQLVLKSFRFFKLFKFIFNSWDDKRFSIMFRNSSSTYPPVSISSIGTLLFKDRSSFSCEYGMSYFNVIALGARTLARDIFSTPSYPEKARTLYILELITIFHFLFIHFDKFTNFFIYPPRISYILSIYNLNCL